MLVTLSPAPSRDGSACRAVQLGARHEALQKLVAVLPDIKHKVSYVF